MSEQEKDVKDQDSSTDEKDVKKESESSADEEVFEGENRSIPYARFKEKASEARELKEKIAELEAEREAAVNETALKYQNYYEGEIAKMQRKKEEDDYAIYDEPQKEDKITPLMQKIEDLTATISSLKSERAEEKLRNQIASLKTVYPELDDEHVLVTKKMKPKWTLEECAEHSHKYFEDRVKSKYSAMMAKKKEAAKKPLVTGDGKLNVAPSDRPKTFKDAKKRMMEYARQLDGGL